MKRPYNPWLEHLSPEDHDTSHGKDAVRFFIEEKVADLTSRLVREHNLSPDLASAYAANLIVSQALAVQREASPDGYQLMLTSLAIDDPALQPFRKDLMMVFQRATSQHYRAGLASALIVAMLGTTFGLAGASAALTFGLLAGLVVGVMVWKSKKLRR